MTAPIDTVRQQLEAKGCDPKQRGEWWSSDDAVYQMSLHRCIDRAWANRRRDEIVLGVLVASNGVRQVLGWCPACGKRCTSSYPHSVVAAVVDIDHLPVMRDNRNAHNTECERCGSTDGTEWHHFAPRHLFDDADSWPMAQLCRTCHDLWHRKTRTGSYYRTEAS